MLSNQQIAIIGSTSNLSQIQKQLEDNKIKNTAYEKFQVRKKKQKYP